MYKILLPEKVALADGADILALPVDDRNGSIAVVQHFFKNLAKCAVVVEVRSVDFG
mgnify:CR=1 FL=1